ncbi:hypothetical protein ERJ75_000192700 [Trypanosoma vivax]|uniref:Uncharacterized protein n=1 Tax=Trypanosoma vivax (strain Y486) TaxID=1055687 RepID=G0UA49_TRYVY|nr:hypothetical protein TRVL_03577 [Trypanosoma vivax]KAH8619002.1 hypothetical protein ERJ75_000192700 [Trypanosoma vivax]CCC52681.1 conserved hypothetical protein [Trypanosoma vivax Y486]
MLVTDLNDVDAEDVVVLVSFQCLLSQEGRSNRRDEMREVPVEGHYAVVSNPWGGAAARSVAYEAGFVFSPSQKYFSCTDNNHKDWCRRMGTIHGVAPCVPQDVVKKFDTKGNVKVSLNAYKEAQGRSSDTWLVTKDAAPLVCQLTTVCDKVRCCRYGKEHSRPNSPVVFLTTKNDLKMVVSCLSWLAKQGAKLPNYAVKSIQEWIPATETFFDACNDQILHNSANRCPFHRKDWWNNCTKPFYCCRSTVHLLSLIVNVIGDHY